MMVQRISLIFGVVFVLVAIFGFLTPGGMRMEASMEHSTRLLGLFPINLLHNIVHLVFGIWGLAGSRSPGGARGYCRGAGLIYLVLAALGLVSPTTFGLIPIGGHDIWLHAVIGLVLTVVGFAASKSMEPRTV